MEDQLVPVQLRLPKEQRDELQYAGKAAVPRRSLPGEIMFRLAAFEGGGSAANSEGSFARALGDLVVSVVNTIEPNFGGTHISPQELGTVRDALVAVFNDGLGATDPADAKAELPLSRWAAFPFIRWLKWTASEPMHDEPPFIKRITRRLAPAQAALDLNQDPAPRRTTAKSPNKS